MDKEHKTHSIRCSDENWKRFTKLFNKRGKSIDVNLEELFNIIDKIKKF